MDSDKELRLEDVISDHEPLDENSNPAIGLVVCVVYCTASWIAALYAISLLLGR